MKSILRRSLIALATICFLSLSFSMQDKTQLKSGDYKPIPKIQKNTVLSHQDRLQSFYSAPELLQGLSDQEVAKIQLGSYESTLKGRSILAVDVDNDNSHEIVVDFGTMGFWLYDPMRIPKWQRLSTKDAEYMIAADRDGDGSYEIYVSWGLGNGSEFWEDGSGWHYFNNTSYHDVFFCSADINDDGNEEIVVNNISDADATYGLYIARWETTYFKWEKIHTGYTFGSHAVAFNIADDELVSSFNTSPRLRWWNWHSGDSNWTDNWTTMADIYVDIDDCTKAEIGDDAEDEFIVDCWSPAASVGTWIYNYNSSPKWTRINQKVIFDLRPWPRQVGTNDEIVCALNGILGLWFYGHNDPIKWNRINGLTPDTDGGFVEVFNYDSDSDWDLAVDFGANGLWKYDYYGTTKWTSMNGSDPLYMIKANIDDDTDDELIVVFESSPSGIWIWDNSTTPKWQRINGANPD